MKAAMYLFRFVSILVLLACLLTVSGASAATKIPVNVSECDTAVWEVSSDPWVLGFISEWTPGVGLQGKEGLEGIITGSTIVRIKPNAADDATLHMNFEFAGDVWEAGTVVWTGKFQLLGVGSGGPTDATGTWRSLDSRVHFVGTFAITPEALASCAKKGLMGGQSVTGQLHITPARR